MKSRTKYIMGGGVGDPNKSKLNVQNDRWIPLTERNFYEAIKPYNDTLSLQQYYLMNPADRVKLIPNSNFRVEQGKKGSTANKGRMLYYQNVPKQIGPQDSLNMTPVSVLPEYGAGGVISGIGGVVSVVNPLLGAGIGLLGGLLGQNEQQKEQEELLRKQKQQMSAQTQMTGQAGMIAQSRFTDTFQEGGKVKKVMEAPRIEMLPPAPGTKEYNAFFGPMSDQLYRIKESAVDNKNLKVALAADQATSDLNNYSNTPWLMGKSIPTMNKQMYRVQNFVNSLTPEQISQLGKKLPEGIGGKIKYVKDLNLSGKQMIGALDAWSLKNRLGFEDGGTVPVELEKEEVFQLPNGNLGKVNGPSHAQGGVDMNLPAGTNVWSDKLKTRSGKTFAQEAEKIAKQIEKYKKILSN